MAAGSRSAVRRRQFVRLGAWTGVALLAVGAAVVTASTETGSRRIASLANPETQTSRPAQKGAQVGGRSFDAEQETRRLSDAVRVLAADRDRLLTRLMALERNLDDVTGSVPGNRSTPQSTLPALPMLPSTTTSPPAAAAAPAQATTGPNRIGAAHSATQAPQGSAASAAPSTTATVATPQGGTTPLDSVVTRTEFGIDLGGNPSMDGLRAIWTTLKASQPSLFEGLRPLIAIRENPRQPGGVELRLVVGPLANAAAAARLCAALSATAPSCQASVFDGQRLALQ
jgi:hypothetical protein